MKKLLFSILAFIPLIALLVGVNVYVDPSKTITHATVSKELCSILNGGHNAFVFDNIDDRSFKSAYISQLDTAPGTVILGSSRGFQLNSLLVGDEDMFNLCVAGGVMEDVAGMWGMLLENDLIPSRAIITVDPWYFDPYKTETRWERVYPEYVEAVMTGEKAQVSVHERPIDRYSFEQAFSVGYFQTSLIEYIKLNRSGSLVHITPTDEYNGRYAVIHTDGSFSYPRSYEFSDEYEVRQRVTASRDGLLSGYTSYSEPDSYKRELFERVLDSMEENDVTVEFLLTPFYPEIYDALRSDPKYASFFLTDDYVRSVAKQRNIRIIGASDPFEAGFTEFDYMDALHLSYKSTCELFESES